MKKNLLLAMIFLFLSSIIHADNVKKTLKNNDKKSWYKGLFFNDSSLNFESIRILGEAYYQGSDIGEVVATLKRINQNDITSWYKEWLKTADRVYELAEEFEKGKDIVSARKAFFRASNYYRAASFYLDGTNERSISCNLSERSINSFDKAIISLPYIKKIKIPYEKTELPGYFIKSKVKSAPLIIIFTGYDGTKEEIYFTSGKAAFDRGYNVILFEGPGQGEVLRKQNIHFRYDWENVVTPVINFAEKLPGINKNKIAIMGRSMGGYLAPRAAAFDHRITACIANGGVYDFTENIFKNFPPDFLKLMNTDPDKFNNEILASARKDIMQNWFWNNGFWTFGVNTPSELLNEMKKYTLKKCVKDIKCNLLVVDSVDDMFEKGQPQKLYSELNCPKTLLVFDNESTGEAHCQEGANGISNERIFSWLNRVLDFYAADNLLTKYN